MKKLLQTLLQLVTGLFVFIYGLFLSLVSIIIPFGLLLCMYSIFSMIQCVFTYLLNKQNINTGYIEPCIGKPTTFKGYLYYHFLSAFTVVWFPFYVTYYYFRYKELHDTLKINQL